MIKPICRQRGVALLVSLIMLVVLTLFVVTAINSSSVNLKIVGAEQNQKAMESAAQQAIEQVISNQSNFSATATATTVNVNAGSVNAGTVTVSAPQCVGSTTARGYSLTFALAPQDTNWEMQANVTDSTSGATAEIRQGVKIRLPNGNCP
jgi:Tfp pilus assembly protein PilX